MSLTIIVKECKNSKCSSRSQCVVHPSSTQDARGISLVARTISESSVLYIFVLVFQVVLKNVSRASHDNTNVSGIVQWVYHSRDSYKPACHEGTAELRCHKGPKGDHQACCICIWQEGPIVKCMKNWIAAPNIHVTWCTKPWLCFHDLGSDGH